MKNSRLTNFNSPKKVQFLSCNKIVGSVRTPLTTVLFPAKSVVLKARSFMDLGPESAGNGSFKYCNVALFTLDYEKCL